jgi:hypothetical protein
MYPSQPYGYYPQPQFAQPAFPQYPVSPYQQTPQQPGALVPNDPFAIPPPSGSLNSRDVFTESSPSAGAGGYSNPQEPAPGPISEAPTDIPKKGGRKKSGRSGSFTPTTNSPAIARNKPAVVRRSSVGKNNIFVCLLPLGIGQFYQGKILLGGAVALAQVGSIYYALDSKSKAEAQAVKAKTVNDDPNFTDVEKTAFLESSNVYIDEQNKAKDMGFMLFGAAWAVGAAEAIVNPPKVRRTRSSYSLLLPEKNSELAKADEIQNIYSEAVSATPQANISLELGLIAMEETKEDSMAPVWGANLNIWW